MEAMNITLKGTKDVGGEQNSRGKKKREKKKKKKKKKRKRKKEKGKKKKKAHYNSTTPSTKNTFMKLPLDHRRRGCQRGNLPLQLRPCRRQGTLG